MVEPFTSNLCIGKMNAQGIQTVRGYVQALPAVPAQAGREETARVAVVCDDGTAYHVLHKGPGIGLLADINAHVEVTGLVSFFAGEDAEDTPASPEAPVREDAPVYFITVKSYRLTDGFDDPWYDDAVR